MLTEIQKAAYLAGFIDGEGWVIFADHPDRKSGRRIGFTNTDKALIDRVLAMFLELGFVFNTRKKARVSAKHAQGYDCYLVGGRSAFERFHALIPLQHPGKRDRLEAMLLAYMTLEDAGRKRAAARTAATTPERRSEIGRIAIGARYAMDAKTIR